MMPCIARKLSADLKSFNNFNWCLVIIFLLNNLHYTTSALSTTIPTLLSTNNSSQEPTCNNVLDIFQKRDIAKKDLPATFPIKDVKLRYCEVAPGGSCCNQAMEHKMALHARQVMDKSIRDSIQKMSQVLSTRSQKFNELFRTLLQQSKEGFHSMFKQTYGVIYEQNSYVFSELFVMLEGYFLRGKIDLTEKMDNFFNLLYQKMFTVINSHYHFNDEYLNCVSEYMKELKPFGDVPDKLSVQVKRSFVATRTFVQALSAAAEVAKTMMQMRPPVECNAALTKMSSCGSCMGYSEKPCEQYCVNVMKACLQQYAELDTEWDNFVTQMEKVSDRLLGPFNIVMVVEPINIKISEAIMNFQESGTDISKRVFLGCGQPKLGRQRRAYPIYNSNADLFIDDEPDSESENERSKRSADPTNTEVRNRNSQEIKVERLKFDHQENYNGNRGGANRGRNQSRPNQRGSFTNGKGGDNSRESSLDKLVKEIRQKVKDTRKFWSNLPYTACNNDDFASAGNSDNCWNGQSVNRYVPNKSLEVVQLNGSTRQHSTVAQQLFTLKTTTSHLKNAYNGNDVEWSDNEESDENYESGSGSGSGIEDDDGTEDGSGIDLYPDEIQPTVVPHSNPVEPDLRHDVHEVLAKNDVNSHHPNTDATDQDIIIDETKEPKEPNEPTSSANPSTSRESWRKMRMIVTYFLPIVMAWLGGSISGAIADLL